ncbi:MAG: hypothetical protein HQK50_03675 [Oligoflexia bacterium]|nr:hypothetical protein [Oligoflexia bacterium]MBF0364643.1 hypothetical protein [Oligoflexia bacterium]
MRLAILIILMIASSTLEAVIDKDSMLMAVSAGGSYTRDKSYSNNKTKVLRKQYRPIVELTSWIPLFQTLSLQVHASASLTPIGDQKEDRDLINDRARGESMLGYIIHEASFHWNITPALGVYSSSPYESWNSEHKRQMIPMASSLWCYQHTLKDLYFFRLKYLHMSYHQDKAHFVYGIGIDLGKVQAFGEKNHWGLIYTLNGRLIRYYRNASDHLLRKNGEVTASIGLAF